MIFLGLNVSRPREMGTGLCVTPRRKEEEDRETSTGWRGGGLKPAIGTPSCSHEPFGKATAFKISPFKHGLLVQLDEGGSMKPRTGACELRSQERQKQVAGELRAVMGTTLDPCKSVGSGCGLILTKPPRSGDHG